jgi:hypothetical protein
VRYCLRQLVKGFNKDYVPPGVVQPENGTLKRAITDCSKQGRLLLLNLTINSKSALRNISLPEENFIIYSAPFNSRGTYETARYLPITKLPFCGLFICASPAEGDCTLLDTFNKESDLERATQHFMDNLEPLMRRRNEYEMRQENINIVVDQDYEYKRLEKEALEEQEAAERERREREKQEQEIREMANTVRARFSALPPEPEDSPDVITIRCKLPSGAVKTRSFLMSHPIQYLYDFVAVDTYPEVPIIRFGFPMRKVKELSRTFAQESFTRKEAIVIQTRHLFEDEYSEEEF